MKRTRVGMWEAVNHAPTCLQGAEDGTHKMRSMLPSSRLLADKGETRAGESMAETKDRERLAKEGEAGSSTPAMGQTGIQQRDSDSEPFLLW